MSRVWGEQELALFHAHKRIVTQVVSTYTESYNTYKDDLYSFGYIGLWQAVDGYNTRLGTSFDTWARKKIAWAIKDGLRELDLISRNNRAHIKHLTDTNNLLAQRLRTAPTWKQLRDAGVAVDKAVRAAQFSHQDQPELDYWLNERTTPGPEVIVLERDEEQRMSRHIAKLPASLAVVIELLYYGDYQQQEVGEILGVSPSRISQMHRQAVRLLRDLVADEFVNY